MKMPKILGIFIGLAFALVALEPVHAAVFSCPAGDVDCLIDAINAANANGAEDTISLGGGIYTLTVIDNGDEGLGPNGLPVITSNISIKGESANSTVIERTPGAPDFRVLQVADTGVLTLEMLTIRNGRAVERMGQQAGGAGIHNNQGAVKIINSVIANNFSKDYGGGVYNRGGQMEITGSTIQGNQSWSTGGVATAGKGGIPDAALIISDSTITSNESLFQSGGGIGNGGQLLTIVNSTIANNSADERGGGIGSGSNAGTVTIINSTIYNNSSRIWEGNGDIWHASPDPLQLQNSILGVCADTIDSLGYNILGELRDCDIDLQPTDMTGDPGLGVFTDDGTPGGGYYPLLLTSQAIDNGNNDACTPTDQLGNPRVDGDGDSVIVCDIGAIEFQDTNQPPTAICQDVTVPTEPGLCSADASVDDGSNDPDGDPITLDQRPPGPYELGDTEVTLTVTDDKGDSDTCDAMVTVEDQEAPVISSVTANPNKLWPPNHKMVPVTVAVDATDNCDSACQIVSVASNEPVNGLDDGNTAPDWVITGDLTLKLRAERSGTGSGRIYTITVECADSSGNSSTDTATVTVPHDKGKKKNPKNQKKK